MIYINYVSGTVCFQVDTLLVYDFLFVTAADTFLSITLRWRHNDHDDVSNHQLHGRLLNRLFRRRSKKTSKLRVTGLCVGNSPGPVNSPHKGPVKRKMFLFDDVTMNTNAQTHTRTTLKPQRCHDANFVATGGTEDCHKDNFRCHQWKQSWQFLVLSKAPPPTISCIHSNANIT